MIRKNKGVTLLELIIALALIGILITPFLGIHLSFARTNQISRVYQQTGSITGNLYEKAKGMTLPELSAWISTGSVLQEETLFRIEADRYVSEFANTNVNYVDLIVTQDSSHDFLCHLIGDSIHEVFTFSGNGTLLIQLSPDENHIIFGLSDESGKYDSCSLPAAKASQEINLYTYGMGDGQHIIVNVENQPTTNWYFYIYEQPFQNGRIELEILDKVLHTRQIWNPIQIENVFVSSRKTDTPDGISVYLQIHALKKDANDNWKNNLISRRQGVFIVDCK